jgi:hypothetical protein
MVDRQSPTHDRRHGTAPTPRARLQSALDQFREDCRLYHEAVGSYNTHLDNHRDRCDLHAIPFRAPITAHDGFDAAIDGDCAAIEELLEHLIGQAHLDSELRRHPRTYPIHVEAVEHLEIARERLVTTLEEALRHEREIDD